MSEYIDGFAFTIAKNRLDDYKPLAEAIAVIWKEHGALAYSEFLGDDMSLEGTLPFPKLLSAKADETIIFGWVVFASRDARDAANAKVDADPRMHKLMMSVDSGFDPERMAYGGFKAFIQK